MNIAIVYETKYGSTKEIAERIKVDLESNAIVVDLKKPTETICWEQYDAFILGSGIYAGKWLPKIEKLIKSRTEELSEKKVWFFSNGPTGDNPIEETIKEWKFPAYMASFLSAIKPQDVVVFKGKMELEKMNFLERFIITKMKAPVGDFRNWEEIESWTQKITSTLQTGKND